jgi:kynurenine formamidase
MSDSPSGNQKSITYRQVIDLSHGIHPEMPHWPGDPATEFEPVAEIVRDRFYLRRFSMGEHSGTHMNAPNSFHPNGPGIDTYTAASLVVPAVVIDLGQQAAANPDYVLTQQDIRVWEQQQGQISPGSVVLLYTGWQTKWHNPEAFFNSDQKGNLHFPGFSREATQFLLEKRSIAGLGTDTHSVDPGLDTTFTTNRLVLQQQRLVLENLTNLDQLCPTGVTLVIGILRLKHGSGSPVSVLAFIP